MRSLKWFAVAAALVVLVCAPAVMAEEAKVKAPAKDTLKGVYAQMVTICKLSDQQVTDLKTKVKARDDAVAAWMTPNADKMKAADEAVKKAKEGSDKAAGKKANEDRQKLMAERTKIEADGMVAIYAVLTPEQKQAWDGQQMYMQMSGRFKRANLTEEQRTKIRPLCDQAAKDEAVVKGDEKAARKAKSDIQAKVIKTIEDTILTAEQKAEMAKKQEPKAKAAGEKAAEKPAAK
jgi:Spy/CpxP family protein refolding chaperone